MFIYKAAVVGGGAMGSEIAQVITYSGLPVVIKEINQELLQKALTNIRKIYQSRVDKGKMTAQDSTTIVRGTTIRDWGGSYPKIHRGFREMI